MKNGEASEEETRRPARSGLAAAVRAGDRDRHGCLLAWEETKIREAERASAGLVGAREDGRCGEASVRLPCIYTVFFDTCGCRRIDL